MKNNKYLARGWRFVAILAFLTLLTMPLSAGASQPAADPTPIHFRVRLTEQAASGIAALGLEVPVNGRAYVIITRSDRSEPRRQISVTGTPFWGVDVQNLPPGGRIFVGPGQPGAIGYPLFESVPDLPEGDYFVQAFLNVYTTFNRGDGHVVRMHKDTGSGQNIWTAPGNAYSKVATVRLGGNSRLVDLELTEVIPPIEPVPAGGVLEQANPPDRPPYVEFFKIKSELVSQFWGQDMHLGANILLPEGYYDDANADVKYPVIYLQGHFPGSGAPFGFTPTNTFGQWWRSANAPRFIAVTFRHASPYYDDSYAVNSANHGPYGDALVKELIPAIEARYRTVVEPWARVLAGGSTGGWEAAALKVWYPESFGHTWSWCPDPVDFNYYQIVDIYDDPNAYYMQREWIKVEQPSARDIDGDPRFTVKQENDWERAIGPDTRSTGQWAAWEATWSPVGPNGYPAPIWDMVTGKIDKTVAEYWKLNWDINYRLQNNWSTLGPLLQGELHFAVGDADTYFLNEAVHLLQASMAKMTEPTADFTFEYGNRQPHCWRGASPSNPNAQISYPEWIQLVAETIGPDAGGSAPMGWMSAEQAPLWAAPDVAQPEEQLELDPRAQ